MVDVKKDSSFLNKLHTITRRVNELIALVGGAALFFMMLQTTGDVVGRYLFSSPIKGTIEITEMLMLIVVYFGFAYAEIKGKHISANIFVSRLSQKFQVAARSLGLLLGLFICASTGLYIFGYAIDMLKIKKVLEGLEIIPFYPVVFVTAVGFFLIAIEYLIEFLELIVSGAKQ